mmetsp:Transcript_3649/g.5957  ORF Transcript_3649/g.5957 Transcript_3649/m.5957 type:complete len:145 (+) Transcript_3649:46-480(+)
MSADQIAQFKETFKLFDHNGDGTITKEELKSAMLKLGQKPNEAALKAHLEEFDTDGDGKITLKEFIGIMKKKTEAAKGADSTLLAFKAFDKDGNGKISPEELKQAMSSMGQDMSDAQIDAMIKACDADGDGNVDYKEFRKMMGQ